MFPQKVQRGTMRFEGAQHVLLDDKPERLAPGALVRTERNTVALAGSLRGKSFVVNYLRDPAGLVREVWLLSEREAGRPVKRYSTPASGAGAAADTAGLFNN